MDGTMQVKRLYDTPNAIYDCSWTEFNDNLIICACGDGAIRMWEINSGNVMMDLKTNEKIEIHSVECSHKNKNFFLSTTADGFVRLGDMQSGKFLFE